MRYFQFHLNLSETACKAVQAVFCYNIYDGEHEQCFSYLFLLIFGQGALQKTEPLVWQDRRFFFYNSFDIVISTLPNT